MPELPGINIRKVLKYIGLMLMASVFLLLALFAVNAGKQPDLQSWHFMDFPRDSLTNTDYSSFDEYLSAEREYISGIYETLGSESTQKYIKYTPGDIFSPIINGENLNSSFVLEPRGDEFKGGVLLVHGLSDSPYHMHSIGEFLAEDGYYVIALRLPGHGTVPAALTDIRWQDWYQAVEFASVFVKDEISRRGSGEFIMGGFSTGAALNLRYTLERILEDKDGIPDKLLFFSPAFGITPFAELTGLQRLFSWMPLFDKFKWQSIDPEYDPFKYSSWPFNAGYQIYELTKKNWKLVRRISKRNGSLERIPPMIAFQSRMDATVVPERVYELFDRIAPSGSRLYLFDVNRRYRSILSDDALEWSLESLPGERVRDMAELIPEDGSWPESIYAISHMSVVIPPDDTVYGENSLIGSLSLKGEKGVLDTGIRFERLRYNPFYTIMEDDIRDFIDQ